MNLDVIDFYNPWWKNRDTRELKEHLLSEYSNSRFQRDYSGYFKGIGFLACHLSRSHEREAGGLQQAN
jgi:hypothetical protein